MTIRSRLLLSPRAVRDLKDIAAYIARDNPARALTFIGELQSKCRAAALIPSIYPARNDLSVGLRMAVYGRYLIFFRELPMDDIVRVERVLHSARNLRRLY